MVERLLEQPVTATLSDPDVTLLDKHYFDQEPEQCVLLEELVKGLEPFECATVYLSGLVKGSRSSYNTPSLKQA